MAIIRLPGGEAPGQQPPQPTTEGQARLAREADRSRTFNANKFLELNGTRDSKEDRLRREIGENPENITINERANKDYRVFLQNYFESIIKAEIEDPKTLDKIPRHLHDHDLYLHLTSEELNDQGEPKKTLKGGIQRRVDVGKIQAFLDKETNWVIVDQMMSQQKLLMECARAITHAARPPAERQEMPECLQGLPMNVDRGALNIAIEDYIGKHLGGRAFDIAGRQNPHVINIPPAAIAYPGGVLAFPGVNNIQDYEMWRVYLGVGGASAVGAAAGGLLGLPFGIPGIGAMIGAGIPPTIAGILRSSRGGLRLDAIQNLQAFTAISANAQEKAYLKILGVNMDDFRIAGPPPHLERVGHMSTKSEKKIEEEIRSIERTRTYFYTKCLGLSESEFDASPEQFIVQYQQTGGQPEPTDTTVQGRIMKKFKPDNGGIRDMWDQRANNPRFCRVPPGAPLPPPGTPPNYNNLHTAGNLRRFIEARRKVIAEMVSETIYNDIQSEGIKKGPETGTSKILKQKKADREAEGRVRKARTEEFTKRKDVLEKGTTAEENDKSLVTPYQAAVNELSKVRRDAQNKYGVSDVEGIITKINQRGDDLDIPSAGPPPNIAERERQLNDDIQTFASPLYTALGPKATEEQIARVEKKVKLHFAGRINALERDRARVEKEKGELEALRDAIQTKKDALTEDQPDVIKARDLFNSMQEEFKRVADPATGIDALLVAGGGAGVGLAEVDLRTQPLYELVRRINLAFTSGAALGPPPVVVGWPESQNNRPEFRTRIVRAVAEARARQLDASIIPAPGTAITRITGLGVSENQMRFLSTMELFNAINEKEAALGNPLWVANALTITFINNGIQQAQTRLNVRSNAFDEVSKTFTDLALQQDEAINTINFDQEIRQIDTALEVGLRRENIYESSVRIRLERDKFTNVAAIGAGDMTYTAAERAMGPMPKGYYELLDFFFDYQKPKIKEGEEMSDVTSRQERFQRISQVLPPDKFARSLNSSMGLGLTLIPPPWMMMTDVLDAMRTRIDGGRMPWARLRRGTRDIIKQLEDEAIALD